MSKHDDIAIHEEARNFHQRIVDKIKREIAEEERPRVGDTVRLDFTPSQYHGRLGVIESFSSGMVEVSFKTNGRGSYRHGDIILVSRATAPMPRRWYSTGEFFSQIPSHACFLIRWGNGKIVTAGPRVCGEDVEFLAHDGGIANKNTFKVINEAGGGKSIDGGKTWEFFGMES